MDHKKNPILTCPLGVAQNGCEHFWICTVNCNVGPESRIETMTYRLSSRAVIAFRGQAELGLSVAEMARHLGVNTSSVTRAIDREEKQGATQKHSEKRRPQRFVLKDSQRLSPKTIMPLGFTLTPIHDRKQPESLKNQKLNSHSELH